MVGTCDRELVEEAINYADQDILQCNHEMSRMLSKYSIIVSILPSLRFRMVDPWFFLRILSIDHNLAEKDQLFAAPELKPTRTLRRMFFSTSHGVHLRYFALRGVCIQSV